MRFVPSWRPCSKHCFRLLHTFCTDLQHTPMNPSVIMGAKVSSTTLIYLSDGAPSSWLLMCAAHIMLSKSTSNGAAVMPLIQIDSCSLSVLQKPVHLGAVISFLSLRYTFLYTCVLNSLIACSAIVTGYVQCATAIGSCACSCFTA